MAASKESFSFVPKVLSEIQGEASWDNMILYAENFKYDRSNPTLEAKNARRRKDYKARVFTPANSGVSRTSSKYYMSVFEKHATQHINYYQRRMAMIRSFAAKFDCTFKVATKYLSSLGDRRMKSLGSVATEHNEIMDQALLLGVKSTSDGMCGDIASVSSMWESLSKRLKGCAFSIFSVDNCCGFGGDKADILRYFPHLKDLHQEPESAQKSNEALLPPDAKKSLIMTKAEAESFCKDVLESKTTAVGLDCEWWHKRRGKQKVALVQLAYVNKQGQKHIGLLHIAAFTENPNEKLPESLVKILYSNSIEKRGVSVSDDLLKLSEFGLDMGRIQSVIDLEKLMIQETGKHARGKQQRQVRWGMGSLIDEVLQIDYEKDSMNRMSNWENQPLSDGQQKYAAEDAWVSLILADKIREYAAKLEYSGDGNDGGDGDGAESPRSAMDEDNISVCDCCTPDDEEDDDDDDDDDDDAGFGDSESETADWRSDAQRVAQAKLIEAHGLALQSDWVLNPPAKDPSFRKRLKKLAISGAYLVARVKLDAFHWLDRYSRKMPKQHMLFGLFHSCMRDALFHLHQPDVEDYKQWLVAAGQQTEESVKELPKSYFLKRNRCRRTIPSRLELAARVQSVFELFVGLVDDKGVPLITAKAVKQHRRNMEHVWNGCLSDIPGMSYYWDRRKSKYSAPCYATIRGTSQLECYHRWLRACIEGSQLAKKNLKLLLAHFNYRWNLRCAIRSRGQTDFGTYSHWKIEQVMRILGEHVDKGEFADFIPAVKNSDLEQLKINVGDIGFHDSSKSFEAPAGNFGDAEEDEGGESFDNDLFGDVDNDDDGGDGGDVDSGVNVGEQYAGSGREDDGGGGSDSGSDSDSEGDADMREFAPVRTIGEIKWVMELVVEHMRKDTKRSRRKSHTRGVDDVDYQAFAVAWNSKVSSLLQSEKGKAEIVEFGIRKKSPAHLKQFLSATDHGLKLAASIAGVRRELTDLRRKLRDCTASSVEGAVRNHAETDGDGDTDSGYDADASTGTNSGPVASARAPESSTGATNEATALPPAKRRKPRTCSACGAPQWQEGARSNTKFHCTCIGCKHYKEKEEKKRVREALPGDAWGGEKKRAPRKCQICLQAGRGPIELHKVGMTLHCNRKDCEKFSPNY